MNRKSWRLESALRHTQGDKGGALSHLGLLNDQEAFLQKPFGPRTFVHKVQQVLRG